MATPEVSRTRQDGDLSWVDACGDVGELALDCDDDDECSIDTCDEETASCRYEPNEETCPASDGPVTHRCEGLALVTVDSCGKDIAVMNCSAQSQCWDAVCDPIAGECALELTEDDPCGLGCTEPEVTGCDANRIIVRRCGKIIAVVAECLDVDACTADLCDPETAQCVFPPTDCPGAGDDGSTDGDATTDGSDGDKPGDGTDTTDGSDGDQPGYGTDGTDVADGDQPGDTSDATDGDQPGDGGQDATDDVGGSVGADANGDAGSNVAVSVDVSGGTTRRDAVGYTAGTAAAPWSALAVFALLAALRFRRRAGGSAQR